MIEEQRIRDVTDYLKTLTDREALGELVHMDNAAAGVLLVAVHHESLDDCRRTIATLGALLAVAIGAGTRIADLHGVRPATIDPALHSCILLGRLTHPPETGP